MKDILVSRLRLLQAASQGSPGVVPRLDKLPQAPARPCPVNQRVRRRYFQELAAVREEVGESSPSSEDENYPGSLNTCNIIEHKDWSILYISRSGLFLYLLPINPSVP